MRVNLLKTNNNYEYNFKGDFEKTMKYIVLSLLILVSFSAKTYQAHTLTVVTEHSPPYNYQLKNNKIVGIATEKIIKVLNEANIEYTLNIYPWARSYELALIQPNTLIYSIYRNKHREPLFQWVCSLLPKDDLYFFVLKKNNSIQFKTINIENLKKFKIGLISQGLASIYLRAQGLKEGKELYISSNDDTNLNLLLHEQVALIIVTLPSMKMRMKNLNKDLSILRKINFPEINKDSERCMAFSLDTPTYIVDKVRSALHKINKN